MKTCTICNSTKELNEFNKKSKSPDGLYPQCKECKRAKDNANYLKNKSKLLQKAKDYYQNNKEKILEKVKTEEHKIKKRANWRKNRSKLLQKQKEYRHENKDKVKEQAKRYRQTGKETIREYSKKYYSNPLNKLAKKLRSRLSETIKSKGFVKSDKYTESIGCTYPELKIWLENQFLLGMSWENHGTIWSVDHKIPISYAQTDKQAYELNHYLNLQPLWKTENESKNNTRADLCWQKFKRDKAIEEDKRLGFNFNLQPSDFEFKEEPFSGEHRTFIERYEWLGTIGFGIKYVFTARHEGKLAGVVMIGEPNNYEFEMKYEALIHRGACSSWAPKNLNSKLVMFACNWMARNTEKRIFVAYSDPMAGEIGTIYQACNFDYLGTGYGATTQFQLLDGRTVNGRYFTRTSSMKKWAKELGIEWEKDWLKENGFQDLSKIPQDVLTQLKEHAYNLQKSCNKIKKQSKGKYALLINHGKNKLTKTWETFPYPKRTKS